MNNWWEQLFLGNSVKQWIIAAAIIVAGVILLYVLKTIVLSRLNKWAEKTSNSVDDIIVMNIRRSVVPLLYLLIVYVAITYLSVPPKIMSKMYEQPLADHWMNSSLS